MKITTFCAPGSVPKDAQEDLAVWLPAQQAAVVLDAMKSRSDPPIGGQILIGTFLAEFLMQPGKRSLQEITVRANAELRSKREFLQAPFYRSDLVPAATFAIARIEGDQLVVLQGGDCWAVVAFCDESIWATENPVFRDAQEVAGIRKELLQEYAGDHGKVQSDLNVWLRGYQLRRHNQRGGYAVLNGQAAVSSLWVEKSFSLEDVSVLLLGTDGMVINEDTANPQRFGATTLTVFRHGGFPLLRSNTEKRILESWMAPGTPFLPEGSAMAIEF